MGYENRDGSSFDTEEKNNGSEEYKKLKKLWQYNGFMGQPPKEGTLVYGRLVETCKKYVDTVVTQEVKKIGSDSQRRVYHNELAMMVLGQARSGMETATAEKIADFAAEVSYGMSLPELLQAMSAPLADD